MCKNIPLLAFFWQMYLDAAQRNQGLFYPLDNLDFAALHQGYIGTL